ncbi:hypothetical protein GCM10011391_05390 [Pullulanibacillus camelliae]|uniref:Long-chain fatty acid--CoA ligase n=1 Tax=Pullulanibacillus camelliae TaxID=1707096 RepID=A0A8J2YC41_9BACL|nr:class I adenylate-forming enzyme family protein [Pullulanibacillus camelliae]GGE29789.1 hypothetical protein GCM10011391_05390 [Pullulanibacillus camelliae]
MSQVLADWIFTEDANMEKNVLSTFNGDYSLSNLQAGMQTFMSMLEKEGDLNGKKIAILIPHIPRFLELVLAINKLGGIVIPLSPQLREGDLTALLNLLEPHIIFSIKTSRDYSFFNIISDWVIKTNKHVIIYSSENGDKWNDREEYQGNEIPSDDTSLDIIACSSGSTGVPKGIMFDTGYIVDMHHTLGIALKLSKEDRIFQNINPTVILGLAWLFVGLKEQCLIVTPETFDVPRVVQMLKEKKPTKISTTPTLLRTIYLFVNKMNAMEAFDNLQLCNLSGEMITKDLLASVSELKDCQFESGYGTSETGGLMYTPVDIRERIIWKVFDNIDYKIIDGELLFKVKNRFKGYYKREDLTKEILTVDGWYKSGDLATVNSEGEIQLLGRKKDLIKKGGQAVIPGEIEFLLNEHPLVKQTAVIGVPELTLGEKIVAFIVKKEEISPQELKFYCSEKIAAYKVPDEFIFIDDIPMVSGKTDRFSLRNLMGSKS